MEIVLLEDVKALGKRPDRKSGMTDMQETSSRRKTGC